MKKISHSEIQTYLSCQKKWDLCYNQHIKISNPDFEFGEIAHRVMETSIIPSEELYPELKEYFMIDNWGFYFTQILDFLSCQFEGYNCIGHEIKVENDDLKGIIDVVYEKDGLIYLYDYKFTKNPKTQDDLEQDEQLYIYAFLYSVLNKFDFNKIRIGYLSFPKTQIDAPRILTNGKLSKDKAQNTTYELYKQAIKDNNLDENEYLDILDYFKSKPLFVKISMQPNIEYLGRILENIENVKKDMQKGYILEKNGYECKFCPYLKYCKHIYN